MKRYAAYDPPEYVSWRPEAEVMDEFRARLATDAARAAIHASLGPERHLALYAGLVRFRLHDIALKRWVKQGVISKAWLGTGEEAVTIGAVHALRPGDQVGPMIRNAGACHEMGMPVAEMLKAYLGTYDTLMRGRDLHTGDPLKGVIPPISMVAALTPVFAGLALGVQRQGKGSVALTWVGDGATRTTEFHEGASLAVRLGAPAIFVIQNNQVALGTTREAGVAGDLRALHRAYGARGLACDGNNILDVHAAARMAADLCRRGQGPVFLEAETFRLGGHATHDEAEARATFPADLFAHWGRRDPIGVYETWLIESGPSLAGVEPARALQAWKGDGVAGPSGSRDAAAPGARSPSDEGAASGPGAVRKTARRSSALEAASRWTAPESMEGCGREAAGFESIEAAKSSTEGRGRGGARSRKMEAGRSSEDDPVGGRAPGAGLASGRGEHGSGGFDPMRRNSEAMAAKNRGVLEDLEARILAEVEAAAEAALKSRASAQPPPGSAAWGVYSR